VLLQLQLQLKFELELQLKLHFEEEKRFRGELKFWGALNSLLSAEALLVPLVVAPETRRVITEIGKSKQLIH